METPEQHTQNPSIPIHSRFKKPFKVMLFCLYFLILITVCAKLFFEKQFNSFITSLNFFRTDKQETLIIGLSEPLLNLSPLANDIGSRSRLLHIYEPLVSVTPDMQIKPALAISYGSLDDLTWEFRLRPDVLFHNGAGLTVDDVIFSLVNAKGHPDSGVKDFASTIKDIQKKDSQIFHIITKTPDPLLLSKLSSILIFQRDADAVGTGPYTFVKNLSGVLELKKFEKYWGAEPQFENVIIKTFSTKDEKLAAMKNSKVDILANVPVSAAENFNFPDFKLKSLPSLEVNFLMFNFDKIFKDRRLREAVSYSLNTDDLVKRMRGFASGASQFVASGIFGYDPEITKAKYDPDKGRALVREFSEIAPVAVKLSLPSGLEVFGASVKEQLRAVDIAVELEFLPPAKLGEKVMNREAEFFFFGWRVSLGDAADFLTAVVHSPSNNFGQFNGGDYVSEETDGLIELSQRTIDQAERLKQLRQIMKKITVEDIIGIPLFSYEVLYGISRRLDWQPRVDGFILAQEVKL